jgi:tetratricopeptide (TPR) repeat protein
VRPGTPANRTPAPEVISPPTIRYSGVQPQQRGGALDENAELQNAMNLLSSKDWSAARSAFHALAAKVPQSRKYRALLCYARGRETQTIGRNDDALLEFQRALQLDPDLDLAKEAIREVQRKSRW